MRKRQEGAVLVELALMLPLLILLSVTTAEIGRAMYQYDTLVRSVRASVRYMSMQPQNTKAAEAANIVVYGTTAGGGSKLLPALDTNMVDVSWTTTGANPLINTVRVRVTGYAFQPMIGSVLGANVFGLGFTFSPIAATMRSPL